jgi:diadenosine tetraphosphatase ApaH/serine/threonine PP2A family protein phosphatase
MAIAIISDTHANAEALEAVLKDIDARGIKDIWCGGDLVNYGPSPATVLEKIRKRCRVVIRGNHDEAVGNPSSPVTIEFRDLPRQTAEWTRTQLTKEQQEYLANLPYRHVENGVAIVHGALCTKWSPGRDYDFGASEQKNLEYACMTNYVSYRPISKQTAPDQRMMNEHLNSNTRRCFASMRELGVKVCFIGHWQQAEAFWSDGKAIRFRQMTVPGPHDRTNERSIKLETGHIYLFDVGSVGQPRDFDTRACYVIYENNRPEPVVTYRRVCYDFKKTGRRIVKEGLDASLAFRLKNGT